MKKYSFTKLCRREDPENSHPPMVSTGQTVTGISNVFTDEWIQYYEKYQDDEDKLTKALVKIKEEGRSIWEAQEEMKPKIGYGMLVQGRSIWDWIKTSIVRSYYVHDDPDNHPDKLVLPQGFPIESLGRFPEMKKGDVLVATMNSIYLARVLE